MFIKRAELNDIVIPDVNYMQSERGQMMLAAASDSSDRSKDKLDQKVINLFLWINKYLLILCIFIISFVSFLFLV